MKRVVTKSTLNCGPKKFLKLLNTITVISLYKKPRYKKSLVIRNGVSGTGYIFIHYKYIRYKKPIFRYRTVSYKGKSLYNF